VDDDPFWSAACTCKFDLQARVPRQQQHIISTHCAHANKFNLPSHKQKETLFEKKRVDFRCRGKSASAAARIRGGFGLDARDSFCGGKPH